MREILFRGKSVERRNSGRWIEGSLVTLDDTHIFIVPRFEGASTLSNDFIVSSTMEAVDPSTIGQYTGLTDKNGLTKIFEGDVIRFLLKTITTDYVVEWYNGGFVFRDVKIRAIGSDLVQSDADNAEVVGNIHDRR